MASNAERQRGKLQSKKVYLGMESERNKETESQNVRGWKGPLWVV